MTLGEQYEAERQHIRVLRDEEGGRVPIAKRVGNLGRHNLPSDGWEMVVDDVPFDRDNVCPDCFSCGYPGLLHAYIIKHPSPTVGSIVVGPVCAHNAVG